MTNNNSHRTSTNLSHSPSDGHSDSHPDSRPDTTTREDVQELTPGLKRYWLANHRIVAFEATAAYREVVDAWVDSVTNAMAEWPLDRPYLALHDFRAQNLVFSPYARKRSQTLISIEPRVPGYAAIVIRTSIVGYAIQWFMRSAKTAHRMNNRIFFDYDEALNWLLSNSRTLETTQRPPH